MLLLRTLLLAGLVGLGAWWTWWFHDLSTRHSQELAARDRRIEALEGDLGEARAENERLRTALRLLKVDRRLARVEVLDQEPSEEEPERVRTRIRWQEVTEEDLPLGEARIFTLEGDTIYLDALVIKFGDQYVEQGDVLRGTSICLFRRIFGEYQEPSQGFPLDPVGSRPLPYRGEEGRGPEQEDLWRRFWEYAHDREAAEAAGVRAIHGEAPFMRVRAGRSYRVELRASGGLSLVAE